MALRSIGMQLVVSPIKRICWATAPTLTRKCSKQFSQTKQFNNNQRIDFCEQFYKNINKASLKRCTLNENQANTWYQLQNNAPPMVVSPKKTLDMKVPIRKVVPQSRGIKNVSYISTEFKELLRKHDEEMRKNYILSFLPVQSTSHLASNKNFRGIIDKMQPYCICEGLKEARADDKFNVSKKRNFLKCLSCIRGEKSDEAFKECHCLRGECELCSPRLTKTESLKKNLKKSKEKNVKISRAKSVESLKEKGDLDKRYWVGTVDVLQKYAIKREDQQLTEKDTKKKNSKKIEKENQNPKKDKGKPKKMDKLLK